MAGDDWLSLIVLGILGLGAYGGARAKGKSDEEAMDTVRGAGENVADYMQKKSDESYNDNDTKNRKHRCFDQFLRLYHHKFRAAHEIPSSEISYPYRILSHGHL